MWLYAVIVNHASQKERDMPQHFGPELVID